MQMTGGVALDGVTWSYSRPGHFTPEKEPRYRLNIRLGGPQRRYGRFGEGKNLLLLPGLKLRIIQPVAYILYQLR
jgi:hypothetical protein